MAAFTEEVHHPNEPFADPLSAEQSSSRPQRQLTRTTLVLAALAVAVVRFLAGALVQKNFASSPSDGAQDTASGGSRNTGVVPAVRITSGTVKFVDGNTVYVQTADGRILAVKTSGSTAVQVTATGALTDLNPGAQVSVEGSPAGDGIVNATKVTKGK
jgi:hypothetical protein